jgi:hypothetical protein
MRKDARIAMTASTPIISINVKPRFRFLTWFDSTVLIFIVFLFLCFSGLLFGSGTYAGTVPKNGE